MQIPRVNILPPAESACLRAAYLAAFIDTANEHYQRDIATLREFPDGLHASRYLWEYLLRWTRLPESQFAEELQRHPAVYALADDLSRERVPVGAPLWPFPIGSVISLPSALLWQLLLALPSDLYVFDASVSWTVVLTHEHDDQERLFVTASSAA